MGFEDAFFRVACVRPAVWLLHRCSVVAVRIVDQEKQTLVTSTSQLKQRDQRFKNVQIEVDTRRRQHSSGQ